VCYVQRFFLKNNFIKHLLQQRFIKKSVHKRNKKKSNTENI
jgi:hypothetical protein